MSHHPDSQSLSPLEAKVLAALAGGKSVSDAAREAGIHRSTIYNWIHRNPAFAAVLQESNRVRVTAIFDQILELAGDAIDTIRHFVTSEEAPASLRFRAARAILDMAVASSSATAPPPPPAPLPVAPPVSPSPLAAMDHRLEREKESVDQVVLEVMKEYQAEREAGGAKSSPMRKIARNALCPCGSGQKFKRCCGSTAPPVRYTPAAVAFA